MLKWKEWHPVFIHIYLARIETVAERIAVASANAIPMIWEKPLEELRIAPSWSFCTRCAICVMFSMFCDTSRVGEEPNIIDGLVKTVTPESSNTPTVNL